MFSASKWRWNIVISRGILCIFKSNSMVPLYAYISAELKWVGNHGLVSHIDWISSSSCNLQALYCVEHNEIICLYIRLETNWFRPSFSFRAMPCFNLSNVISLSTLVITTSLHVNVTPSLLLIISPLQYNAISSYLWLIVILIMQCTS